MDPYLEAHWGDVHTRLIVYSGDQLRPQMPADLKVRVEESVSVQSPDDVESSEVYFPDVRVVDNPSSRSLQSREMSPASSVSIAEPILVRRQSDPPTERSLQIIDSRAGNRVITTIEFLSLANKIDAAGRIAYRKKQNRLEKSNVNLVEIDLLREGAYVLNAPWDSVPQTCRGPYRVAVSRASDRDNVEMYRIPLRLRLPRIRIPLRPTDTDAVLDLQLLIDMAYENGSYGDTDYRLDPEPPLSPDDAEWAAGVLREAHRR
jgi:hypothetical protein